MFTLADNREIGRYLEERIDEKYESSRAFARKRLEVNKQVADEVAVVRMNNRLTQIKKGRKGGAALRPADVCLAAGHFL